jgi:DNA polymerase elongation subunit (family B)
VGVKNVNSLYLLDAALTETNKVKLKFLDTNGEIREFVGDDYKPYFLAASPLTGEEKGVIKYFSGETETVEKTDLFTGESRVLEKVSWPNPKIALKAAGSFRQPWESEVDFLKSYVYDKGLIFGALHSENNLQPIFDAPTEVKGKFEERFKEVKAKDALKHDQISYWLNLLLQPIPNLNLEFFGVKEIDREKVYATWMLSRIANIPLAEAFSSRRVSEWIKSMIYTYLRKNKILIPTSEELRKGKPTHRVVGALTVAPTPGVYFGTVVCDFESLYPSCIDSFNLSYETVDCIHPECRGNKIPDVDYHVCTKRRGFYSILVGALKELRIRLFKPNSKDNSLSEEERKIAGTAARLLKLITVSSYGVTVRIHGVACPPLAEAITGYSRYALKESWKMAEGKGLRPLYGDTDSLFLDNASNEQVEWLIKTVKERFSLDLAVEKRYNLCVLPKAKKAYFGILPDGTPDIKGVTPIKSNSPKFVNSVFQQCVKTLSAVKNQEEYAQAKKLIKEIVKKAIDDLKSRQVKLEDLTHTVRLYFDPNEKIADMKTAAQQYQCALQLIDAGRKLKRWDTVSFIKVKPFKYKEKIFTVKPAEFVKSLVETNVDDYVRNLLTALNQTFQPMGIKLEREKETEISKWLAG